MFFYFHGLLVPQHNEYNCSDAQPQAFTGEKRTGFGWYLVISGSVMLLFQTVLILLLSNAKQLQQSCFRLIYFNCFVDFGNIIVSGIQTGIFCIIGNTFCLNPQLSWLGGLIALGFWFSACGNCVILALNRLFILIDIGAWAFDGKRTYFWFSVPIVLFLFGAFGTRPPLFNSVVGAYMYVPGIRPFGEELPIYTNQFHIVVNIVTTVSLPTLYLFLFVIFLKKKNALRLKSVNHYRNEIKLFLQVFLICLSITFAAFGFLYIQLFPVPEWYFSLVDVGYQMSSFVPCIVLMVSSREIREKMLFMVILPVNLRKKASVTSHSIVRKAVVSIT